MQTETWSHRSRVHSCLFREHTWGLWRSAIQILKKMIRRLPNEAGSIIQRAGPPPRPRGSDALLRSWFLFLFSHFSGFSPHEISRVFRAFKCRNDRLSAHSVYQSSSEFSSPLNLLGPPSFVPMFLGYVCVCLCVQQTWQKELSLFAFQ